MNPESLHYLFYTYLGNPVEEQDLINEVIEWMKENFGSRVHVRRYAHSVSVLFEDLNQVFLSRLKFHEVMHSV